MGGSLGGIFSNQGQSGTPVNPNNPSGPQKPSFLQNLVQGTAKGAGQGFGQAMQNQNSRSGPAQLPPAPSPAQVDPRFFQPTNFSPTPAPGGGGGGMSSAFYG